MENISDGARFAVTFCDEAEFDAFEDAFTSLKKGKPLNYLLFEHSVFVGDDEWLFIPSPDLEGTVVPSPDFIYPEIPDEE